MANLNSPQIISDLATTQHTKYTFTLETPYGLAIQIDHHTDDKALTISLKDVSSRLSSDSQSPSTTTTDQETTTPSYKYRLFPDWGAGFLWYDTTWSGNPEGEYPVMEDDIEARYGSAWHNAYEKWVDHYTEAFGKQGCDCGSKEHPFPDIGERKAWVLDGMMLAVWLTLQPGVESVEYEPSAKKLVFLKQGPESIVTQFLEELEQYLT
ncbi:hypothetical protein F5Y08DRAFT_340410 [Xylaria arbuscula]|nr:hypothetical protein F5Y08DRAFT_340410 [Xylaria arbuscula]